MESPASANQVPRRWRAVLSGLESAVSAVEVGTASGAQIEDAVRLLDSTANAPPLPRSLWKKLVPRALGAAFPRVSHTPQHARQPLQGALLHALYNLLDAAQLDADSNPGSVRSSLQTQVVRQLEQAGFLKELSVLLVAEAGRLAHATAAAAAAAADSSSPGSSSDVPAGPNQQPAAAVAEALKQVDPEHCNRLLVVASSIVVELGGGDSAAAAVVPPASHSALVSAYLQLAAAAMRYCSMWDQVVPPGSRPPGVCCCMAVLAFSGCQCVVARASGPLFEAVVRSPQYLHCSCVGVVTGVLGLLAGSKRSARARAAGSNGPGSVSNRGGREGGRAKRRPGPRGPTAAAGAADSNRGRDQEQNPDVIVGPYDHLDINDERTHAVTWRLADKVIKHVPPAVHQLLQRFGCSSRLALWAAAWEGADYRLLNESLVEIGTALRSGDSSRAGASDSSNISSRGRRRGGGSSSNTTGSSRGLQPPTLADGSSPTQEQQQQQQGAVGVDKGEVLPLLAAVVLYSATLRVDSPAKVNLLYALNAVVTTGTLLFPHEEQQQQQQQLPAATLEALVTPLTQLLQQMQPLVTQPTTSSSISRMCSSIGDEGPDACMVWRLALRLLHQMADQLLPRPAPWDTSASLLLSGAARAWASGAAGLVAAQEQYVRAQPTALEDYEHNCSRWVHALCGGGPRVEGLLRFGSSRQQPDSISSSNDNRSCFVCERCVGSSNGSSGDPNSSIDSCSCQQHRGPLLLSVLAAEPCSSLEVQFFGLLLSTLKRLAQAWQAAQAAAAAGGGCLQLCGDYANQVVVIAAAAARVVQYRCGVQLASGQAGSSAAAAPLMQQGSSGPGVASAGNPANDNISSGSSAGTAGGAEQQRAAGPATTAVLPFLWLLGRCCLQCSAVCGPVLAAKPGHLEPGMLQDMGALTQLPAFLSLSLIASLQRVQAYAQTAWDCCNAAAAAGSPFPGTGIKSSSGDGVCGFSGATLAQQLAALGYDTQAVTDALHAAAEVPQLGVGTAEGGARLCEALNDQDRTWGDRLGDAMMRLQGVGYALAALAMPHACNNPHCGALEGASEQQLVGGRSCSCAGCRTARYCGRGCQRQHWRQHKPVCQALAAALASTC